MGVRKKGSFLLLILSSFLLYQNCAPIEGNGNGGVSASSAASFQAVQAVLNAQCVTCHSSPTSGNGNVDLSGYQAILDSNILVAGNSAISRLFISVETGSMPQGAPQLSTDDIQAIRDWIDLGAPNEDGNASNQVPTINIVGGDKNSSAGGPEMEFFAIVDDLDGAVLRTIWTQLSGPSLATLNGERTNRLLVSNYVQGDYVFQLLVEDDQQAISIATVRLIVGQSIYTVSYSGQIQPIFDANCTSCHGASGGLSLVNHADVMAGGNSGNTVVPGDSGASELWDRIAIQMDFTDMGMAMPRNGMRLNQGDLDLIQTWIDEGAPNN